MTWGYKWGGGYQDHSFHHVKSSPWSKGCSVKQQKSWGWEKDHSWHKSFGWDKCGAHHDWDKGCSHKADCPDYDFGKLALAQVMASGAFSFDGCKLTFNVGQDGAPIIGTDGDDQWDPNALHPDLAINGTDQGEVIMGLDGDDDLYGWGGNDLIIGGEGDDLMNGAEGLDILIGGPGNNYFSASKGGGEDIFIGGPDTDQGRGNDEINVIWGGGGHDVFYGGGGDDIMGGGADYDHLYGEAGNDKMFGGAGDDKLDGGEGDDYLEGECGDDLLIGGVGDDILRGGEGADEFQFLMLWESGQVVEDDLGDDVICDFDCGEGDVITIAYALAQNFDSLDIEQQGCDTLITLENDNTITLAHFDADDLSADCFQFC